VARAQGAGAGTEDGERHWALVWQCAHALCRLFLLRPAERLRSAATVNRNPLRSTRSSKRLGRACVGLRDARRHAEGQQGVSDLRHNVGAEGPEPAGRAKR